MAFLDNSGDIILDAVLTDTGRMRLARGDGSFKIAKYAFGDDEINYESFNSTHASGSAYYDLEVLQTPVLEAFTNNTSTMKSMLVTLSNNNLLYMPILKLNAFDNFAANAVDGIASGSFAVLVDKSTVDEFGSGVNAVGNYLNGLTPTGGNTTIRTDQGLDTLEIPATYAIDPELKETQYIVEMDNRFGAITTGDGSTIGTPAFIDDDNIASYYLSSKAYTDNIPKKDPQTGDSVLANGSIAGPRGTFLKFRIAASINLRSSDFLFDQLGTAAEFKGASAVGSTDFKFIDTTIRVTGATTGYKIDIPVRFIKKTS